MKKDLKRKQTSSKIIPEARKTVRAAAAEKMNRQWNIQRLRVLLKGMLKENHSCNNFEIEHDFPVIGKREFLFNGRRLVKDDKSGKS